MSSWQREGSLSPSAKVRIARVGIPLLLALAVVCAIIGNWLWVGVMLLLLLTQVYVYWTNRRRD